MVSLITSFQSKAQSSPSDGPPSLFNGLLIVYTFPTRKFGTTTSPTSFYVDEIITALNGDSLVFSPSGALWSSATLQLLFPNPMCKQELVFNSGWTPINQQQYTVYTDIQQPNYYLSLTDNVNGAAGWILYVNQSTNVALLLYNPINRPEFQWDPTTYTNYCNLVQNQDPGCYCLISNPECVAGFLGSKDIAQSITNSSGLSVSNASALSSLKSNCNCNSVCRNKWLTYKSSNLPHVPASMSATIQQPTCSTTQNLTFCGVNLSASDGGNISTGNGVNIVQNCSTNSDLNPTATSPTPTSPTSPTPASTSDATKSKTGVYIAGGVGILVIVIIIFLVIKLKK